MRTFWLFRRPLLSVISLLAIVGMLIAAVFTVQFTRAGAAALGSVTLPNSSSPWTKSSSAHKHGHHNTRDLITVGLWLKNRDAAGQQSLLKNLYNQNSATYHQWLSQAQFSATFAPAASDVTAAQAFLTSAGLSLVSSPDSTLILARGTSQQIESAFHTTLNDYQTPQGTYYGATTDVQVPSSFSQAVLGVIGLSDLPVSHSHILTSANINAATVPPYGGGPFGSGLTPSQISGIYDATSVHNNGNQGQGVTLAVYELSGYKASDIVKYEDHYHLPHMSISNVQVLGGTTDHSGAGEVELDIELQIAMAPKAKKLLVYEAPNTELGALSEYLQIAKDNKADSISTSWGIVCEFFVNSQVTLAENQIFLQMAAQGQSIFAASGDSGAYGCARVGFQPPAGQELQLGDPNNQPYITAVGGTSFQGPDNVTTFDPGSNMHPTYPTGTTALGDTVELPWTDGCDVATCAGGATGGGVSRIWAEPDYAANLSTGQYFPGVIGAYTQTGSYCGQQPGVVCRENPDVSLDADPSTGYSIYCTDPGDSFCATGEFGTPGWIRLGGTSCSAPVWAGIAALDIHKHKGARLGLFNYIVYPFDSTSGYANQFHDIVSKFTNGQSFVNSAGNTISGYAANPGYDLETGIGTPDIAKFINS
ncbi:MAG TPA: S53 family peptidase [Ktedonobacteraceae bacterium]